MSLDLPPRVIDAFATYARRYTTVTLSSAGEGTALEGGTAYLLPSATPWLVVGEEGRPHLRTFAPPAGATAAAVHEALFQSAVEVCGARVAAVLCSGGGEGALAGLGHVRAAAGPTFVQDPATALEPEPLDTALAGHRARPLRTWSELADAVAARGRT